MYNTASHSCMCSAAVNYPIRLLSRQCNPFTTEILAYINGAPQKIIVLSDLSMRKESTIFSLYLEVLHQSGLCLPHPIILQLRMKRF